MLLLPRLVLRLWAEREGPFEAAFTLARPGKQPQRVRVTATVLSRHKGTPRLKPQVQLEGWSAETDTTDWSGFD